MSDAAHAVSTCSSNDKTEISVNNQSSRRVGFNLNPDKQLTKIIDDAEIENFTIEVNNSGQNVNIKCNSGSYVKVAKPSLSRKTRNSIDNCNNVFPSVFLAQRQKSRS